ncbi:MAG: DUF1990 domain-containing protein [Rhodococcus sp. (in: high G+C Gram-positive bacteria)]|uniref:DUF1990 family protein n=1 Tax=Rhodococcus sp. TaxID=1831 RepID=UPI003BB1CEE4
MAVPDLWRSRQVAAESSVRRRQALLDWVGIAIGPGNAVQREDSTIIRTPCDLRAYTYPEVGASREGRCPEGYRYLSEHKTIGAGPEVFEAAVETLFTWNMHRGAGLTVRPDTPSAVAGNTVNLHVGRGLIGVDICCRVVYVVDEPRLKGFAYGTLEGHPEIGEERFVVEQCDDGTVVATISAFSRPGRWYTRLGGPAGRVVQKLMARRYLRALESSPR